MKEIGSSVGLPHKLHGDVGGLQPLLQPGSYHQYKWRWVVLLCFCLLSMANAIMWITFSPVVGLVQDYYGVDSNFVNVLSMVFMAAYIPVTFPASYCLSHFGFRRGVLLGSAVTCVGCWIRYLPRDSWSSITTVQVVLVGGQVLGAVGQPFILNAAPQLAAVWFNEQQRVLATALGSMANALGTAVGFLIPPAFATKADQLPTVMLVEAGIATGVFLLGLALMHNQPPIAPSASAYSMRLQREGDAGQESWAAMQRDFKEVLTNRNFLCVAWVVGVVLGVYNVLATLVNQIMSPFGFSDDQTSNMGAALIISGLFGALVLGALADITHKYRLILGVALCVSSLVGLTLTAVFHYNWVSFVSVMVTLGGMGFVLTPVIPLSLDLGCEITYPASESVSSGLIMSAGQVFGILGIVCLQSIVATKEHAKIVDVLFVLAASILATIPAMALLKVDTRRLNMDVSAHASSSIA
eukprot:TRINITY_DN10538_c0_g1_i1.p1 TRINITY_DN10538_c0_g1~~TRINITY_DN10538_c0_g1_i1.p1  ORF type:complete len:498 (+),score=85.04 TRINITY_DN10538_c0_g1_i1:91-1494(+)